MENVTEEQSMAVAPWAMVGVPNKPEFSEPDENGDVTLLSEAPDQEFIERYELAGFVQVEVE